MKSKLFLSTFLLSFIGVFSVFMTFVTCFNEKDGYQNGIMIAVIFITCLIMAGINVYLKKAWLINLGLLGFAIIYLALFRYEIVGGYLEFYNRVANEYSLFFETAVYFSTPVGKWKTGADTVFMTFYTMIFLSMLYSQIICVGRAGGLLFLVNVFFYAVPVVISIKQELVFTIINFSFVVEMLVISGTSKNGIKEEKARAANNVFSLTVGGILVVVCFFASLIVPKEGYEKASYFDSVGNYATSLYDKVVQKFVYGGNINNNGDGPDIGIKVGDGNRMIDNGRMGEVGSIEFSHNEMFTARVEANADIIYVKQFIGQKYENNTWYEPDKEKALNTQNALSKYNSSTQEFTYDVWRYYFPLSRLRLLRLEYTGLIRTHQLMPIYSKTQSEELFDYDSYYKDIDDYIQYYDLDYDIIKKFLNNLYEIDGMDYSRLSELTYRKYAYNNYLQTDMKVDAQFKELLKDISINSYEDVLYLAEFIRSYLEKQCSYTLSPGATPEGEDFIDYFINKNHKGYCVYFASAATMMFRSKGIPARYVTGFAFSPEENIIETDKTYNVVKVDDSTAHAWVEFYLDDFGWVQLDVTPGNFSTIDIEKENESASESSPESASETKTETESTTQRDTESSIEKTTVDNENEQGNANKFRLSKTVVKNIFIITVILLLIILFAVIIIIRYRVVSNRHKIRLNNLYENDRKQYIKEQYRKYEEILRFIGIPHIDNVSYMDYAKQVSAKCEYINTENNEFLCEIIELVLFSNQEISEENIKKVTHVVDELTNKVYTSIGFFKKIKFKYFLCLA